MWEERVVGCEGVGSCSGIENRDVEVFCPRACVTWLEEFAIISVATRGTLGIRFEEVDSSFIKCVVHFQDKSG